MRWPWSAKNGSATGPAAPPVRAVVPPEKEGGVSKAELAAMFAGYLRDEGYKPETDTDGDVRFKSEGLTYYILIDETDPTYFRVILPGIWSLDSPDEKRRAVDAAIAVTTSTKVAKVFPVKDNVWVAVELYLPEVADFKAVLPRTLRVLPLAAREFAKRMRGE